MGFKFPKKLPKKWIEQIERNGKLGSSFKGMRVVARDARGVVVKTGTDSFKILHDGKNSSNFGYETTEGEGGTATNLAYSDLTNYIRGSLFTITEDGTADSITVAIKRNAEGSDKVKCAIYNSDLSRLGVTEERTVSLTTSLVWYVFNFDEPKPSLTKDMGYILTVWGDYTDSLVTVWYVTGDADQGKYQNIQYTGNFPNPLVPTTAARKHSIYCTYTPGGGPETYTKDFTADSILKATSTKTLTTDAILLKEAIKTLSVDAILEAVVGKPFTADALLQLTSTKTLTADAYLRAVGTKTFTVDSILKGTYTKALTADAYLTSPFTKTLNIDAYLEATQTKTVQLDAYLQKPYTKTLAADAFLRETFTKTLSIDAFLTEPQATAFTVDAFLKATQTKTVTIDAILESAHTKTFVADAFLQATFTKTYSIDAIIGAAVSPGGVAFGRRISAQKLKPVFPVELASLLQHYLEAKLGENT